MGKTFPRSSGASGPSGIMRVDSHRMPQAVDELLPQGLAVQILPMRVDIVEGRFI